MIRGDETYVTVRGKMKDRTQRGVLIEATLGSGWVARQCLSYVTDQAVTNAKKGDQMEFKIMEWAAEKAGLI